MIYGEKKSQWKLSKMFEHQKLLPHSLSDFLDPFSFLAFVLGFDRGKENSKG